VVDDLSVVIRVQTEDGLGKCRFSAAGFADQTEDFPLADSEADIEQHLPDRGSAEKAVGNVRGVEVFDL